ncbi:MAG: hypothetical protein ACK48U_01810, partial [Planctomyces sp.]
MHSFYHHPTPRCRSRCLPAILLLTLTTALCSADDEALRERLKDANGVQTDVWVYNDIPAAMAEARRT